MASKDKDKKNIPCASNTDGDLNNSIMEDLAVLKFQAQTNHTGERITPFHGSGQDDVFDFFFCHHECFRES